jgi:hypothetical protein
MERLERVEVKAATGNFMSSLKIRAAYQIMQDVQNVSEQLIIPVQKRAKIF